MRFPTFKILFEALISFDKKGVFFLIAVFSSLSMLSQQPAGFNHNWVRSYSPKGNNDTTII
ncbi:MAG: hypothetical protein DRJ10_06350, partial [Bacteroidetes bacterium]